MQYPAASLRLSFSERTSDTKPNSQAQWGHIRYISQLLTSEFPSVGTRQLEDPATNPESPFLGSKLQIQYPAANPKVSIRGPTSEKKKPCYTPGCQTSRWDHSKQSHWPLARRGPDLRFFYLD